MEKLTEYYLKIDAWAKLNPKKAAFIVAIFIAFVLGAILF